MIKFAVRLIGVPLMLILAFGALGVVMAQDETYEDPQGRFTVPIPTNWTVEETDSYVLLKSPEETLQLYILVLPLEGSAEDSIAEGWTIVQPDFALEVAETLEPPSVEGVDATVIANYDIDLRADSTIYQAVAQIVGDQSFVILFEGELADVQKRAAQIGIINSGFKITGVEEADLTGVETRPVDDEIIASLETYINDLMPRFKVPGAVVAIVQNGEIVYTGAFGVREMGGDVPMTPDTHMMIGSSGKSLTTTLMATLVDEGLLDWDTPVVKIVPQFKMADPDLTQRITVRNLVCACTGVPRRDFEWLFNADEMTAEDMIESLATFEVFTDFGEAFQYSNQMVATGGYVAAAAGGAEYGDLYDGYAALLDERVLDPVGMPNTTLSFDEVLAQDNYATPHSLELGFEYAPLDMDIEAILNAVAPAGSHWSTAEDMANYLIMHLNNGVTADGTRVASEENLGVTREPQVAVSAEAAYGLGWIIDSFKGVPMIQHGGNTFGFTSDLAFLPDADLGIVILTNGRITNPFSEAIRSRLLELVFDDVDEAADSETIEFTLAQLGDLFALPETLLDSVDETVVQPFTGDFSNDALGDLRIELVDGKLYFDVGEIRTELLPVTDEDNPEEIRHYLMMDGPTGGSPVRFEVDDAGDIVPVLGEGVVEYRYTRVE